jgi:tetratricopeptide (TPR) repeat protein
MSLELLNHSMNQSNLSIQQSDLRMSIEENELAIAWRMHQAGRFADAARRYHALLTLQPDHADALHLFGLLHLENKYFSRAVELIGRAVTLRPERAAFHANLAEAYRALGDHQQAINSCQAALELQPNHPEAANNLALALHSLGRYAEAVDQFRAALEMRPEFALAQNNLGTSLRELGRSDEAIAAFRAAVALDPRLARAHSNLGQMLDDQGEPEEALTHCLEAVRLDPALPAAHNNLGNVYRTLERWTEAHTAYDQALRLSPELAQVHANRGLALQVEGKIADAFVCFQRATELAPDDAEMWRYLANAHAAELDAAAALPCWQRIVALQPTQAGGHSELGWALQDEGRMAEAAECYHRALELQPGHLDALMYSGDLHEELGELAQAEAYYRQAQSTHPWAPAPLGRLATLLRGKLPETDAQDLDARLQRLSARAPARGPLLFGRAYVLDARGDYAQAAACLAEANALALENNRKRGRAYDPAEHAALVDRIIAGFTPDFFRRLSGTGDDSRQPVFVFGMPRSGTTLVEQILASHSRVHGAGELQVARQVFQSVPDVMGLADDMAACLKVLDAAHVRELSQRHRERLDAVLQADLAAADAASAPDRIVDKMPDNYTYLGLLALMFPRATFIHVRRDLRDVALSCWMTNFRAIRWANDPEHLAGRCHQYRRLVAHWQAVLPAAMHEVSYERLVEDFEPEARRLVAACGLEWEPACLQFHQTKRPVRTASVTQVRQPLYRAALARWRNYETALADLFEKLPTE